MMWYKKLTAYSQGLHNKFKRIRRYSKWHVNMIMNAKGSQQKPEHDLLEYPPDMFRQRRIETYTPIRE